jgi:hypothetical protein
MSSIINLTWSPRTETEVLWQKPSDDGGGDAAADDDDDK